MTSSEHCISYFLSLNVHRENIYDYISDTKEEASCFPPENTGLGSEAALWVQLQFGNGKMPSSFSSSDFCDVLPPLRLRISARPCPC